MRVVVLGAGSIGRRHIRNLLALGQEVAAVADPSPDRLDEVRPLVPASCRLASGEAEALDREADLVVICSPTHRHLPQARAALARHRHVFVEKPLSHTMEGVDLLVQEATRVGRHVMVACNLRFLPSLRLVKELLDAGRIGRPLAARAQCGYYLPFWRPGTDYRSGYGARRAMGGGIILDCFHEFDYLRWLLGMPREVFAYAGTVSALEIDTEDSADVLMRFDDGTVANVHLDYLQRTYRRSCDLIGEEGVIAWDYVGQTVSVFGKEDGRIETFRESIDTERNQMFLDEMRHFLRCIETGEPPALDAAGARAVLELALAAKASAVQGRPVTLER
jgi:predicted dehydrogenase